MQKKEQRKNEEKHKRQADRRFLHTTRTMDTLKSLSKKNQSKPEQPKTLLKTTSKTKNHRKKKKREKNPIQAKTRIRRILMAQKSTQPKKNL